MSRLPNAADLTSAEYASLILSLAASWATTFPGRIRRGSWSCGWSNR